MFHSFLCRQFPKQERTFYNALFKSHWVVYAKQAFGRALQVVEYLGRYTHKIAIFNHRIVNFNDDKICFQYKDYRHAGKAKTMTLEATEFIRRFSLHILPKAFVRIRHYGILSSSRKLHVLPLIHRQLESHYEFPIDKHWKIISSERLGYNPDTCPVCKKLTMVTAFNFDRRGRRMQA